MVYLVIFIFLVFLSIAEVFQLFFIERQKQMMLVVIGLVLVFLAGTRYQTGFDYVQYLEIFNTVNLQNYTVKTVEFGFAALNYGLRFLGFDFNFLLVLIATFAIGLKLNFFRQYSPYVFLGVLNYYTIGFLLNDMGQMRFGLAVGIILFAFKDFFNDRLVQAVIKILFAFLFHASAIIVLPVILLFSKGRFSNRLMLLVVLGLMPFLFIDLRVVFYKLMFLIPLVQVRAKMLFYIYSNEFGSSLGFNLSFILRLIIFILLLVYVEVGKKSYPWFQKLAFLYFYGIVLYMVFNSIADFATRTSAYFKTLDCIILPFFVTLGKTKFDKLFIFLIVVAYTFWSFYKLIYSAEFSFAFNPYQSFTFQWFYE
jgi:hypothetical protein